MKQSALLPLTLLLVFALGAIDTAWLYWVHDVGVFSPGTGQRGAAPEILSNEYAKSFWVLPARATGYWLLASAVLVAGAWSFRQARPAIRVYALVTERIAELMTSLGLLALSAQFAVFGAVYAYAEIALYTDPRPLDSLKAIGSALLIYLPLAIGGFYAATAIAANTLAGTFRVHRELTASVRHALSSVRDYRPEPLLPWHDHWPRCEVLFLSDLHITGAGLRTLESRLDCEPGLDFIEALVRQARPRLVVVCGDITDTGDPAAVQRANRFFERLGVPVVGTIGNHDVQFERMNTRRGRPLPYLRGLLSRSLSDPVAAPDRQAAIGSTGMSHAFRFGSLASGHYPALHVDPILPVDLLLIDSNRRQATSPITNAIGHVGEQQLQRAAELLRDRTKTADRAPVARQLIIVLHHHLVLPRLGPGELAGTYFQMCIDAEAVLAFAREHGAAAIFHGHLHMPYVLRPQADPAAPLIASCGSTIFPAVGPNAAIGAPTAFGARFEAGGRIEIVTYVAPARPPVERAPPRANTRPTSTGGCEASPSGAN